MLQKLSDFIKSELQSMLKNRQQREEFAKRGVEKFRGGGGVWTLDEAMSPALIL